MQSSALMQSSEYLSSGYSSANTPIPPDYLMPVSTETMVNGQHCTIFINENIYTIKFLKRFYILKYLCIIILGEAFYKNFKVIQTVLDVI